MLSKIGRCTYLLFLTIVVVGLGFYRDFVFKNINALLKAWDYEADYTMPNSLVFLKNWEYNAVWKLKWILTIICALLFLAVSIAFIKLLFNNKAYIKYTVWAFLVVFFVSSILVLFGFLFKQHYENFYLFSRYLMGMIQSPIILMILIAAFKLHEIQKRDSLLKN